MDFTTVIAPTVITAANAHNYGTKPRNLNEDLHPKQRAFMNKIFGETEEVVVGVTDPRALRRQAAPKVKISLRRRITDGLNAPFEYEMTEAARVVL
ncbi:unnamed protein product [Cylindrotheca closterium]|uniref:Uncharacterized protein n=1 Tax=Cylindrotheca closterium TaxID=2856 RepID=A0AAD2JL23_9STRA|nr:unnamed protein product [Cylindrotheca closterium]